MRRLISVNVLDAFITGAYALVIPLLLVERKIDLATIGLIFSILPLVFVISRFLFAAFADSLGLRSFFSLNAISNFASVVLYSVSSSSVSYALARAVQGVKDASLWAVNRNAAYEIAGNQDPDVASKILFVRALPLAFGAIVSGFLIFWLGFTPFFVILAVLSVLIFAPARALHIGAKRKMMPFEVLRKLDPRSVKKRVWRASIVMSFYAAASSLVIGFVLPIFLRSRGFGYWEIGVLLAAYNALGVFLLLLTTQTVLAVKKAIIVQAPLYLAPALLIPLSEGWVVVPLILMMAIADWTSYVTMENVVADAVEGCENTATAISFLFTPAQLATVIGFALAGLLVENYGYIAPFWTAGMFFGIYSTSAWLMFKDASACKAHIIDENFAK